MTPQKKAKELVDQYRIILIHSETDAGEEILCTTIAKQCALVAVDGILEDNRTSLKLADDEDLHPHARGLILGSLAIWLEVKQEIEKI
jgi:hypothetical protein